MNRLDKFLCDCRIGTRSQVKAILKSGRVTVDGVLESDGGRKLNGNAVCLDGIPLEEKCRMVVMLNKPAGYVTATKDPREKTVMDLLSPELSNMDLKPIGRLDKQTEGLLLLTNDGALLHRLITPKKRVEKEYYVRHEGNADALDVQAFFEGLVLEDGTKCLPAVLSPISSGESIVTIVEGKYHQVRRMMASRGMPVIYLERRREGCLTLGNLARGQIRTLTPQEVAQLEEFC